MPGPSTNQQQVSAKQGCAGDAIETPRKFGADGCIRVRVPNGKTTVLTGINLGASSITIERVIAGKCEGEEYFAPYKDDIDCPWVIRSGNGLQTQPISLPGDYRLCISPANPNAKIAEEVVDAGSAACCAVARTCPPVVPLAPALCAVTGMPAPLVAPLIWQGQAFDTITAFVAAVVQSTGGGTYNYANSTFTFPAGVACPSLVVAPKPVDLPAPPVPCPSIPLPGGGYMYHPADMRDPLATVVVNDCVTVGQVNGYIYPTAGVGHTVEVVDCLGESLGWAQNCSECACAVPDSYESDPIKVAGTGSAVVTASPAGYNVHVEPANLCNQLTTFIAAATGVVPLPTDEMMVVRNGSCAKVTMAQLLADKWFQNTSMSYNPASGEITIVQLDETGAVANTFTIDIGSFVETPWSSASTNTVLVTNGGTNGHGPLFDVNVSGAAGNALSATTQGLYVATPNAPAQTPLVATDSTTIDFTQTGTAGHTFTGVVKVDPVVGNKLVAGLAGLSVIDAPCVDVSAATPVELCAGDTFAGTDPDTCERVLYKLPSCKPIEPISLAAGAVALDAAQYAVAAGGVVAQVPSASAGPLVSGAGGVSAGISFTGAANQWYLVQAEADDYDPALITVAYGAATNATYSIVDQRQVTLVSGNLTSDFALLLVKATADGAVTISVNIVGANTHFLFNVTELNNVDPSNPIGTVSVDSYDASNSPLLVTQYVGGGEDYTTVAKSTRGGIAAATPMATLVTARHVRGADPNTGAASVTPPPYNDSEWLSPGVNQLTIAYTPLAGWIPHDNLNIISEYNDTYVCPLAVGVMNNPPDGIMGIGRDANGIGVVYYVPFNAAPVGSGGSALSEQQVSVSSASNANGCCCPSRAVVDVRAGTIETTMAQGNVINFKATLNGIASAVTVSHTGAGVTTISTPIPLVSDYVTAQCGATPLLVTGSLEMYSVNFVDNAANAIATNFGVRGILL